MTPITGVITTAGAVNADMINPIVALEAPNGSINESSTGDDNADQSGGITFANRMSWNCRYRRIAASSPITIRSPLTNTCTVISVQFSGYE